MWLLYSSLFSIGVSQNFVRVNILSRVRSSVTNNNGSGLYDWIYWHLFTIKTNYNSLQSMAAEDSLRSLLDYECLHFCLIDLVLIYETVTSSASIVRWLTFHSWTLNSLANAEWLNSLNESESYVTTDGQSASLSWNKAPIWGLWPDFYYCQTVAGLLIWGGLSDERTGLCFTISAGPRQRSHSRVPVPWNSRPYFTVSDSRLPFSSPRTTRRVTVEVFYHASTRVSERMNWTLLL
jgi:hypothetical protein